LLRDDLVILDHAPLAGSVQDCPPDPAPATVQYTLKAFNNAGQQDARVAPVKITAAAPQNPLANTNWQLQSANGTQLVPSGVSVTAFFGADGSLTGNAGCNNYTTAYIVNGQSISIQPAAVSGALCGEPADSTERTYLSLLGQAASFQISGGQLILFNSASQEILRYNRIG